MRPLALAAVLLFIAAEGIANTNGMILSKYSLQYPEDCRSEKILNWVRAGDLCYLKDEGKGEWKALAWESDGTITTIPYGKIEPDMCRDIFEPLNTFCKFA